MTKSSNIWDFKPWWCQPWSILLTGIIVIGLSWLFLKIWWLTTIISILILSWWLYFLIIVPRIWVKINLESDY
jgi:hypothetical protein